MTPHTIKTTRKTSARADNFEMRERRIQSRILDGIEATLDELAQPRLQRAEIEREARAQCAALLCRQATCRRAKRCRRQPCKVPLTRI